MRPRVISFRVRVSETVVLVQRRTGREHTSPWRRYAVENGVRRECTPDEIEVIDRFRVEASRWPA